MLAKYSEDDIEQAKNARGRTNNFEVRDFVVSVVVVILEDQSLNGKVHFVVWLIELVPFSLCQTRLL